MERLAAIKLHAYNSHMIKQGKTNKVRDQITKETAQAFKKKFGYEITEDEEYQHYKELWED